MRTVQVAAFTATRRSGRVDISITELLHWAFARECARLDFDEVASISGSGSSVGMEYIMIERARLGCRVDGGGRSDPHPDADIVASTVAALPTSLGGARMAIWMADLARARMVPDWLPNPSPSCRPREWKNSRHGRFAAREYWTGTGRWPANRLGRDDGYCCPVTYQDTPNDIAAARRGYLGWRLALLEVQTNLRIDQPLTAYRVTCAMPPNAPWKKST